MQSDESSVFCSCDQPVAADENPTSSPLPGIRKISESEIKSRALGELPTTPGLLIQFARVFGARATLEQVAELTGVQAKTINELEAGGALEALLKLGKSPPRLRRGGLAGALQRVSQYLVRTYIYPDLLWDVWPRLCRILKLPKEPPGNALDCAAEAVRILRGIQSWDIEAFLDSRRSEEWALSRRRQRTYCYAVAAYRLGKEVVILGSKEDARIPVLRTAKGLGAKWLEYCDCEAEEYSSLWRFVDISEYDGPIDGDSHHVLLVDFSADKAWAEYCRAYSAPFAAPEERVG